MGITSSSAAFDGPVQSDGQRQVIETHTLSDGAVMNVVYYAEPGADIQAVASDRAPMILAGLADAEALGNVDRDGPFTLEHQTGA